MAKKLDYIRRDEWMTVFRLFLGRYNVVEADTQLAVAGDNIVIM